MGVSEGGTVAVGVGTIVTEGTSVGKGILVAEGTLVTGGEMGRVGSGVKMITT